MSAALPLAALPSGRQLVLNTHREAPDLTDILQALYDDIFVEYVVKNPMYIVGQPFQ